MTISLDHKGYQTRCVHAGEHRRSEDFTPVSTPIHPSVGFVYESMEELDAIFANRRSGYVYPRYGSPTVEAFECAVANLEAGEAAIAFGSGMAALHIALLAAGAAAGKTVLAALDVYGATYTLLQRLLTALGVQACWVDVTDLSAVQAALEHDQPVALLVETISNPLLKLADLPALADLAHRYGTALLVDNTFATPLLIQPLASGADYVIHSATKYMGGHGDVMAGVVITSAVNRLRLYELNKLVGSILGPFEAWLALRGLKTLPLRFHQQCNNAVQVAAWLKKHPGVQQVNYPGLAVHPQHLLAQHLFGERGFGAMLSFELSDAGQPQVFRFMERLQLFQPATTLGDIYSLALHPATSSHRSLTPEERQRVGIHDNLVRLSIGIEDVQDLIADLEEALG